MWNCVYVYGDHAYAKRKAFERAEQVSIDEAETVRTYALWPKFIFRVDFEDDHALTTDPVDVRRITCAHPEADVAVIKVIH